jgi:hypothetical protein
MATAFWVRPFSAHVFSLPSLPKRPLIEPESRFYLYNDLEATPELDKRRTFHRYLLGGVHLGGAAAAVVGGFAYRRPDAGSVGALALVALLFPYLASTAHSVTVVSYQRVRVLIFVLVVIAGAVLTGSVIAGALGPIDPIVVIDVVGAEVLAFMWGGELLLHVV